MLCWTSAAGAKPLEPSWKASMTQVPMPVKLTIDAIRQRGVEAAGRVVETGDERRGQVDHLGESLTEVAVDRSGVGEDAGQLGERQRSRLCVGIRIGDELVDRRDGTGDVAGQVVDRGLQIGPERTARRQ